jgi:hypothetical protein
MVITRVTYYLLRSPSCYLLLYDGSKSIDNLLVIDTFVAGDIYDRIDFIFYILSNDNVNISVTQNKYTIFKY